MTTNLKGIATRRHKGEQQVLAKRPRKCFLTYGNLCPFLREGNCRSRGGSLFEAGHQRSLATGTSARQCPPASIPVWGTSRQTIPSPSKGDDACRSIGKHHWSNCLVRHLSPVSVRSFGVRRTSSGWRPIAIRISSASQRALIFNNPLNSVRTLV